MGAKKTANANTESSGTDPREDVRIYIGPTMHRRALVASSCFRGGLPAHVESLAAKIPDLARVIVPLSEVVAARRRAQEPGTEENRICRYLLTVRFDDTGGVRE